MPETFVVFDVESIGLHGEAFAVGWVVMRSNGELVEEGLLACNPDEARGNLEDRRWVEENVPTMAYQVECPKHLRDRFWSVWRTWSQVGAVLVADCAWPVEARFLNAMVDDARLERRWLGPYPLHDLASMQLALGGDPLAPADRLQTELPAHHPLNDARQSARMLAKCLQATAMIRRMKAASAPS